MSVAAHATRLAKLHRSGMWGRTGIHAAPMELGRGALGAVLAINMTLLSELARLAEEDAPIKSYTDRISWRMNTT